MFEMDLQGWGVAVVSDLGAPWDGPTSLEVTARDVDAVVETDGITAELLRKLPMGEIRKQLKQIRAQLGSAVSPGGSGVVLERVETDLEYALMAREYLRLVEQGFRSPIARLADGWGMSRNTISGRIRRARAMGFLDGPTGKPADRLTEKSRRLLEEQSGKGVDQPS
ncbi:hypothetical protein ACODT5_33170 [Streptomyces sp. 5.8]|uniref:hypothetical protein n=1 Tax=Streptomyces sp. 5.8 TaxID=3406571 RepID=UPI003BB5E70F